MARITTPVPGYTGKVIGVSFEDGVGETDDEAMLAYFPRAGYGGVEQDEPEDDEQEVLENELLGNEYTDPDSGPYRDAADPRNDLIPVGGVKGDGTIVAGPGRGKRVSERTKSESTSGRTSTQATAPGKPVQELGDPGQQSATPAGTNPIEATADQQGIPTGTPAESGSESAKSDATKEGSK